MNSEKSKKRKYRQSSSFYYKLKKLNTTSVSNKETSEGNTGPNSPASSSKYIAVETHREETQESISSQISVSTGRLLEVVDPEIFDQKDSEDEEDSGNDSDTHVVSDIGLKNKLKDWALTNRITHVAITPLLKILKENGHNDLPLSARTLLHTPAETVNLQKMGDGEFWFNDFSKNIQNLLKNLDSQHTSLSFIIHIDGLPPYKSSIVQFWPILFLLEEIPGPPMVAAIYCGETKPPLKEYLQDFVLELKKLIENGLTINGIKVTFSIKYIVCDTPARSFIKGVVGFSAFHGCIKCTTVGEYDRGGRHMSFPNTNCPLRTDESFRQKCDEDHHKEDSPLLDLPINMVDQIIVADSLHLLDLGIMRKCLYGWVYGTYNLKKNKLSAQQILLLSDKLMRVNATKPSEIHRNIRPIRTLKNWKGVEYRTMLLYLGPIILKDFLSIDVFHNFMVLHTAITMLSCDYYYEHVAVANQLIIDFINQYAQLYGSDSVGNNVHNLCHIVEDVRNFGNLSRISSYVFENYLGKIKMLLRSGGY